MTLEVELDEGVATKVAEDGGLSEEAAPDGATAGCSCNERRPPSSFSPKLSL